MIRGIDHIGILVRSIADALPLYTTLLGLRAEPTVDLPEQQVRVAFVSAGNVKLELIEPMAPDSPLGRVLAKRGEGLLHLCLEVEDAEQELRHLAAANVRLVHQHPWPSPHGLAAFLHPASFRGVSIELRQHAAPSVAAEAEPC